MGYCNTEDVKAIVDSDMEVAEIQDIIDETDAFIDGRVPFGTNAMILRAISKTWAAYRVMLKDPTSERIGDISSDRSTNLKLLKEMYLEMIDGASASGGLAFSVGKAEYIR